MATMYTVKVSHYKVKSNNVPMQVTIALDANLYGAARQIWLELSALKKSRFRNIVAPYILCRFGTSLGNHLNQYRYLTLAWLMYIDAPEADDYLDQQFFTSSNETAKFLVKNMLLVDYNDMIDYVEEYRQGHGASTPLEEDTDEPSPKKKDTVKDEEKKRQEILDYLDKATKGSHVISQKLRRIRKAS